jgi:hypothetical protein
MNRDAALAVILVALLLPACGAMRHPEVGAPADFALGVTVLGSADAPRQARALRPAQYLVEADGTFRVAIGAGVEPTTYPPRVRRLSRRQVERLWSLVDAAGYNEPAHAAGITNVEAFRPTPRDGWAIIDITARGDRQALGINMEQDENAARLTEELAGLAWIR